MSLGQRRGCAHALACVPDRSRLEATRRWINEHRGTSENIQTTVSVCYILFY